MNNKLDRLDTLNSLIDEAIVIQATHRGNIKRELVELHWTIGQLIEVNKETITTTVFIGALMKALGCSDRDLYRSLEFYLMFKGNDFESILTKIPTPEGRNLSWTFIVNDVLETTKKKEDEPCQHNKILPKCTCGRVMTDTYKIVKIKK